MLPAKSMVDPMPGWDSKTSPPCWSRSSPGRRPVCPTDRNLEGARRVVLDAVHQAQGRGCGPGILGVCLGGDRGSGYHEAKVQLMRRLDDRNPVPELDALERRLCDEANQLGIGPMGFGGKTTVLGVKIGTLGRVPASYQQTTESAGLHLLEGRP
jgi:tartrate dehydratase alpha subunit/fumarate hydratase class I-like protein